MKPIYINQNDSNEKFLYLQLYDIIKQRILTGEMKSHFDEGPWHQHHYSRTRL